MEESCAQIMRKGKKINEKEGFRKVKKVKIR